MVLKLRQERQREGISKQYCYITMTTNTHIKSCIAKYYIKSYRKSQLTKMKIHSKWLLGVHITEHSDQHPSTCFLKCKVPDTLIERNFRVTLTEKPSQQKNTTYQVDRKMFWHMNINREEKETGNEGKKTFHGTLTCLVNV